MANVMTVLSDGSEQVPYYSATFPMHTDFCRLRDYPAMTCVCHWHHDLEFVLVRQGSLRYQVNDQFLLLTAGQGVAVLPDQIHGITAVQGEDAVFLCVVFPSGLADVYPDTARSAAACLCDDVACIPLDAGCGQDEPLLVELARLAGQCERRGDGWPLAMLGCGCQLLAALGDRLRVAENRQPPQPQFAALQEMMGFIQAHYAEHVTLETIAKAGMLSKSACTQLFRRVLHLPPIKYLNDYRIERSMALLRDTALPMTEIASLCGLCSPSYFSELFQKRTGMTPTTFRRSTQ